MSDWWSEGHVEGYSDFKAAALELVSGKSSEGVESKKRASSGSPTEAGGATILQELHHVHFRLPIQAQVVRQHGQRAGSWGERLIERV